MVTVNKCITNDRFSYLGVEEHTKVGIACRLHTDPARPTWHKSMPSYTDQLIDYVNSNQDYRQIIDLSEVSSKVASRMLPCIDITTLN